MHSVAALNTRAIRRPGAALLLWLVGLGFAVANLAVAISDGDGLLAIFAVLFGSGFAAKAVQSAVALMRQ